MREAARRAAWTVAWVGAVWASASSVRACEQDAFGGATCFVPTVLHGGPGQDRNFCEDSQDWVAFNACAGRMYVLSTSALGPMADTVLDLYGPDCTTLTASDDNGGGGLQSRIHWIAPASGVYHLRARQADGSIGEDRGYHLTVTGDTSPCRTFSQRFNTNPGLLKEPHAAALADGGWILTLNRYTTSGIPTNPSVARFRPDGTLAWITEIGTPFARETAMRVTPTLDGGFLVAVFIQNVPPSPNAAWIAKLDAAGALLWSRSVNIVRDVVQARSSVLLTGGIDSIIGGETARRLLLRRVDAVGTSTLSCSYNTSPCPPKCEDADQFGWAVAEARNGDILVAGERAPLGGFPLAPFIMRFKAGGTPIWGAVYSGPGFGVAATAVAESPDGSLYFVSDRGTALVLVKLDGSGSVLWARSLGTPPCTGLAATENGGVLITMNVANDGYFVAFDGSGNVLWSSRYGAAANEVMVLAGVAADGGLRIASTRDTFGQGLLLLATDEQGRIPGCTQSSTQAVAVSQVQVTRTSLTISGGCVPGDAVDAGASLTAVTSLVPTSECTCSVPSPYTGLLSVARPGATSRVSWTAGGATRYDVVRGGLQVLHGSGGDFTAALDALPGEACLASGVTSLFADDLFPEPAAGDGRFYLLRPEESVCFAPGTYDEGTLAQALPRDPPIEASSGACP